MLSPFGKYLEYKEFMAEHSTMHGAVKPVVRGGKLKFMNALTGKLEDTFEEAEQVIRNLGVTGVEGTGIGSEVTNAFLTNLDKEARRIYGDEVSVDIVTFDLSGEKSFLANKLIRGQGMIVAEDATTARGLRIRVGAGEDARFLSQDKVLDVANKAGYELGFNADKYGKRMKTWLSEKQIHFNIDFGQYKMGVFNPIDILEQTDDRATAIARLIGWDEDKFAAEISAQVDRAYPAGRNLHQEMINAMRHMDKKGKMTHELAQSEGINVSKSVENVFNDLKNVDATKVRSLLKQVRTRKAALKAFDGQGLISDALIHAMIGELEGKLKGPLTGAQKKEALRQLGELESSLESGIFNVRASGFQVEELFGKTSIHGIPIADLRMQAKANYSVVSAKRLRELFGIGEYGIIAPDTNIQAGGVGGDIVGQAVAEAYDSTKRATLTLEPQKGKAFAWMDILTPSTGSQAITETDLDRGMKVLNEAMDEITSHVAWQKSVQAGAGPDDIVGQRLDSSSRALNIFIDSIESGLHGENYETMNYYQDLIEELRRGEVPVNELPVLIERFRKSLFRQKHGGVVPRVPLTNTARTYAVTSAIERLRLGEGEEIISAGMVAVRDGRTVFSDTGVQAMYDALGGFDLDDAMNVVFRADGNEGFEAILYRQPNTTDELARVKIQNVHKSNALKTILKQDETSELSHEFKRASGLLEEASGMLAKHGARSSMSDVILSRFSEANAGNDLYQALNEALDAGDTSLARDIIDRQAMTRLMGQASDVLQKIDGITIARNMPGSRFGEMDEAGKITFPGVTRKIGGQDFQFNYKQLFEADQKLTDALDRVHAQAPYENMLGRWVNAKGTLGMWLDINKETLEGLKGRQAQEVLDFLNKADFYLEESVIDAFVQGSGVDAGTANQMLENIRYIWEEQARLTLKIPGLRMDEYMVKNRMIKGELRDKLLQKTDEKLNKGIISMAEERLNALSERALKQEEEIAKNVFSDIKVSSATQQHADTILQELSEIEGIEGMSEFNKRLLLRRRFFSTFSGPEGKFGRQAAELFVALSQDGRHAGLVRGLKFGLHTERVLRRDKIVGPTLSEGLTLDSYFRDISDYVMPTEGFKEQIRGLGIADEDLARLADEAWEGVSAAQEAATLDLGPATLAFDRERRLLPQSIVEWGDEEIATLGEALPRASEDELKSIADKLSLRVRERVDALGDVPTQVSRPVPEITAATGDTIRRGGMLRSIWDDIPSGGRKGIIGAAIGIAASMVYNAKRDHDYTEEQIGPPQEYPEQYNQGLALSGANMSRLENTFGTAYDIRTRGGDAGSGFLEALATMTGGDVRARTYRDPHRDTMLEEVVGGQYR